MKQPRAVILIKHCPDESTSRSYRTHCDDSLATQRSGAPTECTGDIPPANQPPLTLTKAPLTLTVLTCTSLPCKCQAEIFGKLDATLSSPKIGLY